MFKLHSSYIFIAIEALADVAVACPQPLHLAARATRLLSYALRPRKTRAATLYIAMLPPHLSTSPPPQPPLSFVENGLAVFADSRRRRGRGRAQPPHVTCALHSPHLPPHVPAARRSHHLPSILSHMPPQPHHRLSSCHRRSSSRFLFSTSLSHPPPPPHPPPLLPQRFSSSAGWVPVASTKPSSRSAS